MNKEKCENCKWHIGNKTQMWCARHAPVAMANLNYHKDGDHRIVLSEHPETYADACCGDFKEKENE